MTWISTIGELTALALFALACAFRLGQMSRKIAECDDRAKAQGDEILRLRNWKHDVANKFMQRHAFELSELRRGVRSRHPSLLDDNLELSWDEQDDTRDHDLPKVKR